VTGVPRPRTGTRSRVVRSLVVVAIGLYVVATSGAVGVAQSAATRSGDAEVVSAGDHSNAVATGNSKTDYSLALPDGAACPGDSANDNYRVQSFLIPSRIDPGALTWSSIGPSGPGQIALYGTDTNQFVNSLTNRNPGPGQPGVIPTLGPLTFGVYDTSDISPGPYLMGIACTLFNTTTNYWDVAVDLTRDTTDEPAQIRWTVSGAPTAASHSSSDHKDLLIGGLLVALLAVGVAALILRRRTQPGLTSKESR